MILEEHTPSGLLAKKNQLGEWHLARDNHWKEIIKKTKTPNPGGSQNKQTRTLNMKLLINLSHYISPSFFGYSHSVKNHYIKLLRLSVDIYIKE